MTYRTPADVSKEPQFFHFATFLRNRCSLKLHSGIKLFDTGTVDTDAKANTRHSYCLITKGGTVEFNLNSNNSLSKRSSVMCFAFVAAFTFYIRRCYEKLLDK